MDQSDISANTCVEQHKLPVDVFSVRALKGLRWALFLLTSLILFALTLDDTIVVGSWPDIETFGATGKLFWLGDGFLLGATSYSVLFPPTL